MGKTITTTTSTFTSYAHNFPHAQKKKIFRTHKLKKKHVFQLKLFFVD